MVAHTSERPQQGAADAFMLRMLRLPETQSGTDAEAQSAFQQSIVISGIRCLLTYIVFPFVLPTVGFFAKAGPIIGILVSLAAVVSITISMRRFFGARHPKRWHYASLAGVMLVFIAVMFGFDIAALV